MRAAAHRRRGWFLLVFSSLVLLGCYRQMPIDDPSLKPFADMFAVDRAQYGFSPLPSDAKVYIERDPQCYKPCGYDVMLHIYNGKTSHEVSFQKKNGIYKWVGEQEVCWGPREYRTVNGRFNENLVITYAQGQAGQLDGLHINYSRPEDPMGLQKLSVAEANMIRKALACE